MPELAEKSLSPKDIGVELQSSPFATISSEKELKQPEPDILDDEFHVDPNLDILRPLPITDSDFSVREKETLQKGLEEEFEYLSRTRQLEIDSERVKTLQDIMDKMTGPEIKTRLVIMNKGEKVEGAVFPDGTVVISQSLFNYLDTIEELAGVLGHEIGHLINKTHRRVSQVPEGLIKQFGVKWAHEAAADLQAPRLLEKIGLNSLAYASAIEKIQGIERGMEHQSGLSRASMVVGAHFFIDSKTAHLPQHPFPEGFQRNFRRTNLEIAQKQILECSTQEVRGILEVLHPKDLEKIYKILWSKRDSGQDGKNWEKLKIFNELVLERSKRAGYGEIETILMLISHPDLTHEGYSIRDSSFINSHEKLKEVVGRLNDFENSDQRLSLHREIFKTPIDLNRSSPSSNVLSMITEFMYDSDITPTKEGIPVTDRTIQDILESFSTIRFSIHYPPDLKERQIANALAKYIRIAFFEPNAGEKDLDLEKLRVFLTEVKNRKTGLASSEFINRFYIKPAKREKEDPQGKNHAVLKVYSEVFNVDISEGFDFEDIDNFFRRMDNGEGNIQDFIRRIQAHFNRHEIADSDRVKYMNYINKKINQLPLTYTQPILEILKVGKNFQRDYYPSILREKLSENDKKINQAIIQFRLKAMMATTIFSSDGDEFYQYLEQSLGEVQTKLGECGISSTNLSKTQMINLFDGLFKVGWSRELWWIGNHPQEIDKRDIAILEIKDLDRFFKLPFIKDLAQKEEYFEHKTIQELIDNAQKFLGNLLFNSLANGSYDLYQDGALSLLIGPDITRNFNKLLDQDIPETQFDEVLNFLYKFFPEGVQREEVISGLRKRFLESKQVPLDQKINYLVGNLESVGYEGVLTVVGQIYDISTYRQFRDRMGIKLETYLSGNPTISVLALGDIVSSSLVRNFEQLLETTKIDPATRKSVSERLCEEWLKSVFYYTEGIVIYAQAQKKFILNQGQRAVFKTAADAFFRLKSLSPIQRFAIAHKALTEENGALATAQNREKLANVLTTALGLKSGFISLVLQTAVREGDAKYMEFPASNMVGSLLFRALNLDTVDISKLANMEVWRGSKLERLGDIVTEQEISTILHSYTRDIILFGASARKDPSSRIARLAQESDDIYYSTLEKLRILRGEDEEGVSEAKAESIPIDPGIEAVIKGVESAGALGIRALQLSSQFYSFSPGLDRRLSESFDSNPGMDRLRFWENLDKLTRDSPDDKDLEYFLQRVRLGGYLGGGSLQTTFRATLTMEDGTNRQIIIKRQNPSVQGLIKQAYLTSHHVLKKVSEQGDKQTSEYAKTGMLLIDLAQGWCIADVNDATYIEYDDKFRQTVDKFNQAAGKAAVLVPERIFTRMLVKSEDLANGATLNKILKDDTVPLEIKRQLVEMVGRFFIYQMRGNGFMDDQGKRFFLVHSDPHVGNYMADVSSSGINSVSVIDRSMYLKLYEKEVKVLGKLFDSSNPNDFVYSFIDLVLDSNKDINRFERMKVTARVFKHVTSEYVKQMVKGKINKFALLGTLLKGLSDEGKDVPLRLRLMVRNIGAFQELGRRYGVDFESLYKQVT